MPLLERVKFVAICANNLDEFFQVRVAALKDQIAGRRRACSVPTASAPTSNSTGCCGGPASSCERQEDLFLGRLAPALADRDLFVVGWDELDVDDRKYLAEIYERRIHPVLTPLAVRPGPSVPVHLEPVAEPRRDGDRSRDRGSVASPG